MRRLWFLIPLLWASIVSAQVGPAPGIQLQDEGTGQGRIQTLNCVGTGIACTKSGVTGTATISGGGVSGNGITLGAYTALSATAVDYGSVPTGTKRIVVTINGASTNGTSQIQVQIGDSGGVENTSYVSSAQTSGSRVASTTGFVMEFTPTAAANVRSGKVTLDLMDAATFHWVSSGTVTNVSASDTYYSAGIKALSAELTTVRITTVNGTDTFDAGNVNIAYDVGGETGPQGAPGTSGVTTGVDVVQNPWTASTVTTISHTLGAIPSFVSWYLENLTGEAGYVAGDRVYSFDDGATARGFSTFADATTTGISTSATATGFFIGHKTTGAATNITIANWKIVVKSFLIN